MEGSVGEEDVESECAIDHVAAASLPLRPIEKYLTIVHSQTPTSLALAAEAGFWGPINVCFRLDVEGTPPGRLNNA